MEEKQKKHRKYDKQFKEDAVRLITDGRQRASEVARNLGINENVKIRMNEIGNIVWEEWMHTS